MTSRITIKKCTTQYGGHNCDTQHNDTFHMHCMLSIVILNGMMLTVFLLSVIAPDCVANVCVRHRKGILQTQINFTVWQRSIWIRAPSLKAGLHGQYFLAILLSNAILRPAYCQAQQYPGIEKFLLKLHC